MTDQQHPITPPPELVEQLRHEAPHNIRDTIITREVYLITAAYRAGADQELEACCEWMVNHFHGTKDWAAKLRAARRPRPSLKEQAVFAVAVLRSPDETCSIAEIEQHWHTIRRALEQLND